MQRFSLVFLFFSTLILVNSGPAQEPVRFQQIRLPELYQNTIFCIAQDSLGFLWFGTNDGLLRYDGYQIVSYRHRSWDSNTVSDNSISQLLTDHSGMIWIATWGGGLDVLNPYTGAFTHYRHQPENPSSISDNRVQCLIEDKNKNIWAGTFNGGMSQWIRNENRFVNYKHDSINDQSVSGNRIWAVLQDTAGYLWVGTDEGLDRFNPLNNEFRKYRHLPDDSNSLSHNRIRELLIDRYGCLWAGTQHGLNRYDPVSAKWTRFYADPNNPESLSSDIITTLWEDRFGKLWIGTNRGGLCRYRHSTRTFERFLHEPGNPFSLSHIDIRSVFEDQSGIIWVGTRGGGLNKLDQTPKYFTLFQNEPYNPNSLSNNIIWALYEDKKGNIWIGTDDGGLNHLNRMTGRFTVYKHRPGNPSSISHNRVWSVCEDHQGVFWIGTDKGLNRFDPSKNIFRAYSHDPGNPGSISNDYVLSVIEDSRLNLWSGTYGGINYFDREKNQFSYFPFHTGSTYRLSQNRCNLMIEDHRGHLWLATDLGLYDFNPAVQSFKRYLSDPADTNSLSNNNVISLYLARNKILWIGTAEGLNGLDIAENRFIRFFERDGLPNDYIHGILEDDYGNMWVSTNQGICKLHPESGLTETFDRYDGLQNNSFNSGAYFKNQYGEMLFGGDKGFNLFHPDRVRSSYYSPPVVITSFKVLNQERPVYSGIQMLSRVFLNYNENFLSFEFSSLDYTFPENNQYAYYLEGIERGWNYSGTRRYATYTNIEPGDYTFRVKGTNHDGIWNEQGASVGFHIAPPFWGTWWFRGSGLCMIIMAIAGIHYWRLYAIRLQNRKLESEVEKRTRELQQKKNELEKINVIVKSINSEIYLVNFLNTILKETKVIRGAEKASALVFDPVLGAFRFAASVGWDLHQLQSIQMPLHETEERYVTHSLQISEEIFIKKNLHDSAAQHHFRRLDIPKSVLVVRIKVENKIGGYLIFDNFSDPDAFDEQDVQLLVNLKEHILSGFIKAKILGDLETANQELIRLNEKKNEFLGIAAHDLRNPLGAMIGFVDLMIHDIQDNTFNPEEGLNELEIVLKSARNMSNMINDLLDISAIESGKVKLNLQPNDLNSIIQDCETIFRKPAQAKNIDLQIEFNPSIPPVQIDRNRIAEVVDNLVSNAIKYTYPGGRVRVYAEKDDHHAVIHVEDTGQGLDESDMKEMFSSFKKLSTRPTGGESSTGLGLAIVKKIVEVHGGKVWVKSKKGVGSTFSFSVPIQ